MSLARLQQHSEGAAPDLRRFAIPAAADRPVCSRPLFFVSSVVVVVCVSVSFFIVWKRLKKYPKILPNSTPKWYEILEKWRSGSTLDTFLAPR